MSCFLFFLGQFILLLKQSNIFWARKTSHYIFGTIWLTFFEYLWHELLTLTVGTLAESPNRWLKFCKVLQPIRRSTLSVSRIRISWCKKWMSGCSSYVSTFRQNPKKIQVFFVQSNLSGTTTLGTLKLCPLLIGKRCSEVSKYSKCRKRDAKIVVVADRWSLTQVWLYLWFSLIFM
jgi:hypothetical protein